ncbi:MAG: apolipoprotein N-acyltransferase [Phycisphaerales bacterium]|nr:MAG: apolipoprotein N-acyltransferase [Phycisphaerales bacterium]
MPVSDHAATLPSDANASPPAFVTALLIGLAGGLIHALVISAAFAAIHLELLILLAPLALALTAQRACARPWSAGLGVYLVSFLLWLWVSRWLVQVTPAGLILYALIMAIYPALFMIVLNRAMRHPLTRRIPTTLLLPVIWVGIEFFRGEIFFHGYPWYLMTHPLIELPILVQSADLFGIYGLGFLFALPVGAAMDLLLAASAGHLRSATFRFAIPVAVLLAINVAYGVFRMQQPLDSDGPRFIIVQTDLDQDIKERWSFEQQQEDVSRWLELSAEALIDALQADEPPDAVIWPETTVPGFGFEPETVRFLVENRFLPSDVFTGAIERFVERTATPMLVGTTATLGLDVRDEQWHYESRYNSVYLIRGDPPYPRYDKRFLTPFGETMPYISAWPWLEEQLLDLAAGPVQFNLDEGSGPSLLPLETARGQVWLAAPICFEATMSRVCRHLVRDESGRRADVMINLTNDGWFGWHDLGRKHHAQSARFRTIELRTPMVRSANTGMSMVIDSRGTIRNTIGDGRYGTSRREAALRVQVPLDSRETLYLRIGNLVGWISLAGLLSLPIVIVFINPRAPQSRKEEQ